MDTRSNQYYALRLRPQEGDCLAGEVEQVRSGERRSFDSAAALIACLQALQRSQVSTDC